MSAIELTKEEKTEIEKQAAQYLCPLSQQYVHTAAFFSCGQDHLAEEEMAVEQLQKNHNCPVCKNPAATLTKNKHFQRTMDEFFSQPRHRFLLEDRYELSKIPPDSKKRQVSSQQIASRPALEDPFLPDDDPDEQKRILAAIQGAPVGSARTVSAPSDVKTQSSSGFIAAWEKNEELNRLLRLRALGENLNRAVQLIVELFSDGQGVRGNGDLLSLHPALFPNLPPEVLYKLIYDRIYWLPPLPSVSQVDYFVRLINWAKTQTDARQKLEHLLWKFLSDGHYPYRQYATLCIRAIKAFPAPLVVTESDKMRWMYMLGGGIDNACFETVEFLFSKIATHVCSTQEERYRFILTLLVGMYLETVAFNEGSWQARKTVLEFFVDRWRAELFPTQPTEQSIEYVVSIALHILNRTNILGMPLDARSRQSKQSELFQLLVPRQFINCSYPRDEHIRLGGDTILHNVVRNNTGEPRRSKVAFLLQHGANLNAGNQVGDTVLILAMRAGDWPWINWLLSQPGLIVEQTNHRQQSAYSIALYSGQFSLAWLLVKKSPIYWRRFLLSSAITLTLLAGGAGALLFFFYSITLAALICFGFAGLCLLLAAYQFLASPVGHSNASLPPLEGVPQDLGPLPAAALAPHRLPDYFQPEIEFNELKAAARSPFLQ